jgi:DNA-directed RNA polymerase specialized sigma24 family protein
MTAKIQAVAPRLSDEDPDPIEQDETEGIASSMVESAGWLPWDVEDIADIRRLITVMPEKQRKVLEAFLQGLSYNDIGLTEKHWRYHFMAGIEFIKKELKL